MYNNRFSRIILTAIIVSTLNVVILSILTFFQCPYFENSPQKSTVINLIADGKKEYNLIFSNDELNKNQYEAFKQIIIKTNISKCSYFDTIKYLFCISKNDYIISASTYTGDFKTDFEKPTVMVDVYKHNNNIFFICYDNISKNILNFSPVSVYCSEKSIYEEYNEYDYNASKNIYYPMWWHKLTSLKKEGFCLCLSVVTEFIVFNKVLSLKCRSKRNEK